MSKDGRAACSVCVQRLQSWPSETVNPTSHPGPCTKYGLQEVVETCQETPVPSSELNSGPAGSHATHLEVPTEQVPNISYLFSATEANTKQLGLS